jgi:hypothetical protein
MLIASEEIEREELEATRIAIRKNSLVPKHTPKFGN